MAGAMTEQQMAELASYHVGIFAGVVSRERGIGPAEMAHAMRLLAQEAKRRRRQWLTEPGGSAAAPLPSPFQAR